MQIKLSDYQIFGDNTTNQTQVIQRILDENKVVELVFEKGIYLLGSIQLSSNQQLSINKDATLKFSNDLNDYPIITRRFEGYERLVYRPAIYAKDGQDIIIKGEGTLDGQGSFWWDKFKNDEFKQIERPTFIGVDNITNLKIMNLKIINSPSWTIHPLFCNNVLISNLHIINPATSPNTDGINPESCCNVKIINNTIDVGDDCIALKAGVIKALEKVESKNIIISNNHLLNGHGGIVIGSEMSGDIRNVVIDNCIFDGTDRGIRVKSRRTRGGIIENVVVSNLIINNTICPIVMNLYYNCCGGDAPIISSKEKLAFNEETPTIRNIRFNNIIASNVYSCATYLLGLPESYIQDIYFSNIKIIMDNKGRADYPAMIKNNVLRCKEGLYMENVMNIHFDNYEIDGYINHKRQEINTKNIFFK